MKINRRCPFCHEKRAELQREQDCAGKLWYFAMCHECGACGPLCETADEAVATWNEREVQIDQ